MGKYLLDSREIDTKWQPTDNTKPVPMIKKRLAGNQIIIAYMRKVKAFKNYIAKPSINAKRTGTKFKVTGGGITLTKNDKSIDFIFEIIRREEDWQKKLEERMKLYQDFYESFVEGDSGFSSIPQLILVCEDDRHMAETFKEVVTNKLEISEVKLYYTTDLAQNADDLTKSLYEFNLNEDTGKYKIENIEIKLLG